jgi:ribosomal small subunit protein bTHX
MRDDVKPAHREQEGYIPSSFQPRPFMGKGDLRSRRGKIHRGTFGNSRNKKALKARRLKKGKERRESGAVPQPPQ